MAGTTETILLKILGDSTSGVKALSSIQKRLLSFGAALTGVSVAALTTFAKLGEGGATLDVLDKKFDRMARSFGKSADELMSSWTAASRGVMDEAGLMQKSMYMAMTGIPVGEMDWMLQAAQNAADATGRSFEELFDQLAMGLARGSAARLDDLGIIVKQSAAEESYARSIGKTVKQLTLNDKKMAMVAAAREAATRQEQILGKSTESSATVIARARASWKNAGDDLKKLFIPVATAAAKVVTFFANAFRAIPAPVKQFVANMLALTAAFGAVLGPMMMLKGALPLIKLAFSAIGVSASGMLSAIAPLIVIILALVAVGALIAKAWKEDWGGIQGAVMSVVNTIKLFVEPIINSLTYWFGELKAEFGGIVAAIRGMLEPALQRLSSLLYGLNVASFMTTLRDAVNVVMSTVKNILSAIRLLLEGKSDEAWAPLKDAALNVVTLIVIGWRKYVSKALVWGWNLIVQFANGVIKAGKTVLSQAATFIGNIIGRFLKPGSPPKEGPLRGIVKWGKGLMDTYFKAFKLADFGILRDSLAPLKQALDSAVSLGDVDAADAIGVFRQIRQETASLIAGFRETGEISESALGSIAEKLGEGGEEYAKYLRLTLEHQQALERLKTVQAEVSEAEKKGFIPANLKAKLSAAEEEADKAKEAVDWQKEYLAALQDGVDLQREMIDAMRELSETMKGAKGDEGAVEPEEAIVPEMGAIEAGEMDFAGFGGFSEEFEGVKAEVAAFFSDLPAKMAGWWEQIKLAVATKGLELIANVGIWWEQIKLIFALKGLELIANVRRIWDLVKLWIKLKIMQAYRIASDLWEQIKLIVTLKAQQMAANVMIKLALLYIKIRTKLSAIKLAILTAWVSIVLKAASKWEEVKTSISTKWDEIKLAVATKIAELKTAIGLEWEAFKQIGIDIFAGLWEGLKEKWQEVKGWILGRFNKLGSDVETVMEVDSPSKVFERIGKMMAAGVKVGFDLDAIMGNIQNTLSAGSIGNLAGATAGAGTSIQIVIPGGLQFPNVRDGRDVNGIVAGLQRKADEAKNRASVPGGIT